MKTIPTFVVFGAVSALLILNHSLPTPFPPASPTPATKHAPTVNCAWISLSAVAWANKDENTWLNIGPDRQTAIAYFDRANADLKFPRRELFQPAPQTTFT